MVKTTMSQMERFEKFKSGVCPYCGKEGATVEKNKNGFRGYCPACNAENNYSSPKFRAMKKEA